MGSQAKQEIDGRNQSNHQFIFTEDNVANAIYYINQQIEGWKKALEDDADNEEIVRMAKRGLSQCTQQLNFLRTSSAAEIVTMIHEVFNDVQRLQSEGSDNIYIGEYLLQRYPNLNFLQEAFDLDTVFVGAISGLRIAQVLGAANRETKKTY